MKQTISANTNTDPFNWFGGDGTVFATGAFDGGSIKLQASPDGTNWFDCQDADGNTVTLSSNGAFSFSIAPCMIRVNLAGAGGAAAINLNIGER